MNPALGLALIAAPWVAGAVYLYGAIPVAIVLSIAGVCLGMSLCGVRLLKRTIAD